jgi:hypothetical protein
MNYTPSMQNENNVAMSLYAGDTDVTVRSGSIKLDTDKLDRSIKMLEPI